MLLIAKVDQGVEAIGAFDDDVAAAPAVAAVRAAEFDELLAPERDAAGAAVARAHEHARLVEELHARLAGWRDAACALSAARRAVQASRSGRSGRREPCRRARARLQAGAHERKPAFSRTRRRPSSRRARWRRLDSVGQREAGLHHRVDRFARQALAPGFRGERKVSVRRSSPLASRLIAPIASRLSRIGVMHQRRDRGPRRWPRGWRR